jgi:hypothetical protein
VVETTPKSPHDENDPPPESEVEVDILQFDSAVYYVEEEEKQLTLDVVRLGEFKERIQVSFYTEDGSGKAGVRYGSASGTLIFEPGELSKSITVPIIDSDDWNTTLEFKVRLHEPVGCELGRYLFISRVKVIDNDFFPTNRFEEEMTKFGAGKLLTNGVRDRPSHRVLQTQFQPTWHSMENLVCVCSRPASKFVLPLDHLLVEVRGRRCAWAQPRPSSSGSRQQGVNTSSSGSSLCCSIRCAECPRVFEVTVTDRGDLAAIPAGQHFSQVYKLH